MELNMFGFKLTISVHDVAIKKLFFETVQLHVSLKIDCR
jgi:hypothetical protein